MSRQSRGIPISIDGVEVTATAAELNALTGVTATAAELNTLDGYTGTTTELNLIDGYTGTTTELNLISGYSGTTAELNYLDGIVLDQSMVAGAGIIAATPGGICEHSATNIGGIWRTDILIDVTDFNEGDTAGDIIGQDGDETDCNIGQILVAVNGTIIAGTMTCYETPAGGDLDIDLWYVDEGTLNQDTAITAGSNQIQMTNQGNWTAADVALVTAFPPTTKYMYLVTGAQGSDADYTAGIFVITLWGK